MTLTITPYPEALVDYLAEYYGSRDFFECHEIMEHHWKEEKGSRYEECWLVLIRIAVFQYHARRGNGEGAFKLLHKAAREIDPDRMNEIGLNGLMLKAQLDSLKRRWVDPSGVAYEELDIPVRNQDLLKLAQERCFLRGWKWGTPLEELDISIIDRHLLRDRTEVIEERERSAKRKAERQGEEKEEGL
ncbi:DUF309 domain-containing protein [Cohnella thailandensis]|uniref:DUF309 domain-containing protein n=1 Tax=Cohnella thailandensis TaxID=557557 RepID=A0A841T1N4_9BACL|nr:DUF309 domain-containing protein [Cohnella thailandensis]MBB6638313.1 DUF309 domain-containing protein [Cohnella thailandensis]MBP1977209.1 putative metal-dependent hydrolase [Cohnella thailandensis]